MSKCKVWTGACNDKGYGQVSIGNKVHYVHILEYENNNGPVPDGMEVDHTCHNPPCYENTHLRAVTHKQNLENRAGLQVNNVSGVRGVWWEKSTGRWRAMVKHGQKRIHVGRFDFIEDAERAVIAKRNELFTHNNVDRKVKTA